MSQIRSPGYPGISLEQAIELTRKMFDHNRQNPTDREAAAKDIGYTGITGTSAKILSDLSHFGLIEKTGKGGVRVTGLAARVLHPRNSEERRVALVECAYNPGLFQMIREQWPDGFVSENSLRSYLMRAGFSSAALRPALTSYQETYAFLRQEGATESHGAPSETNEESISEERAASGADMTSGAFGGAEVKTSAGNFGSVPRREGPALMSGERVVFIEETNPSQYLRLVASGEMDGSLLEALESYVARQKKRLSVSQAAATSKDEGTEATA